MGLSANTAVIKVTITQTYSNKMQASIVLNISKLQETLPKLSHLIIKNRMTACISLPGMVPIFLSDSFIT